MLEIVLYHPQIPQNTGNIGRLCVNTGVKLHLIKPLGFSLDEKHIRRAGLDYWPHLDLTVHESWENFLEGKNKDSLFFFSTKGKKTFWECSYVDEGALNFEHSTVNDELRTANSKQATNHKPQTTSHEPRSFLIFGSETNGLSEAIYEEYADRLYTIPMYGKHSRSYNLSNSVAIVLFEGIRKLHDVRSRI